MDLKVKYTFRNGSKMSLQSITEKVFVEDDSSEKEIHQQIMRNFRIYHDTPSTLDINYTIIKE